MGGRSRHTGVMRGDGDLPSVSDMSDLAEANAKSVGELVDVPHGGCGGLGGRGRVVRRGNRRSIELLKNGTLKVYKKLPHGMCTTHADVVNPDLLAFIKG